MLFREGDKMRYCPLVEQGELQAFRHTYKGDDKVFEQFVRGEWVALAAVFMEHGSFPMNIRALSAGQAILIPRETLHQFCLQRPTLALQLLGNLSQKLYSTINQIDWLTSSSAGERLADYLLRLHRSQQDTQPNAQVRLPLNRGQLGIRAETLSRMMTEWLRQGYITCRASYITLCNLDYLRALAAQAQRPL
uniref:Cyclic nucleotide-binding domain-containing protein n=1 Tax=Bracon brevicornis TaxID=1563983 RepID=A0A6V7KP00_9HYME